MILVLLFVCLIAGGILVGGGCLMKTVDEDDLPLVVFLLLAALILTITVFFTGFDSRYYVVDRLPQPTATARAEQ